MNCARSGHNGYQTWRSVVARKRGICVRTGRGIQSEETVYKPQTVGRMPANAQAMSGGFLQC
ncbi:DUF3331 domain-containing protein [Paraburkholderia kirstenboschensis]|uniref:DUF3331 domain-containing protein n=1 Tax=Paraburkholderia kirstenboschensis TaxID=1245436 RepID=UPI000FFC15CA